MNVDHSISYAQANSFLTRLKKCTGKITIQQYRTLKGQALSGDIEGAEKGLQKILKERSNDKKYA